MRLSSLLRCTAAAFCVVASRLPAQENSRTWEVVQSPTQGRLNAVCYGNGKWLAFGDAAGEIYRSPDGITWQRITGVTGLPALPPQSIPKFVHGRFLIKVIPTVWKQSFDGSAWTDFLLPPGGEVNDVIYAGDRWACMGFNFFATALTPETWTVSASAPASQADDALSWFDEKFVSMGFGRPGQVFTSPDGNLWTKLPFSALFDRLETGEAERSDGTLERVLVATGTLEPFRKSYFVGHATVAGDIDWEQGQRDVAGKLIYRRSADAARPGHSRHEWVNLEECCGNQRGPQVFSLNEPGGSGIQEDRASSADLLAMARGPRAMVAVGTAGLIRRYPTGPPPASTAVDAGDGFAREGVSTSAAIVDGAPAIAYCDDQFSAVKYVRAADAAGTSWGPPVTVDNAAPVGQQVCLLVVNGNPAVCYYNLRLQRIKYARAADATGTVWNPPIAFDAGYLTLMSLSMEMVGGNPAIAFTNGVHLKYVRATDPEGSGWGSVVNVNDTGTFDRCSLKTVDGLPAIAFTRSGAVLYLRAADLAGTLWSVPVSLSPSGSCPSLQVVNGQPAVSYFGTAAGPDPSDLTLIYARALDSTGSAWGAPITLDGDHIGGPVQSLAVINGKPAIGYYSSSPNRDLKYVQSTDANGAKAAAWGSPLTVDTTGDVGKYASLLEVDGRPALIYHDALEGSLRYLRATDPTGGTRWPADIVVAAPSGAIVPDDGACDLGVLPVNTASNLIFTLQNPNSGSEDLTIEGVTLDGPDAADFAITSGPAENTLAGQGATTFTVNYAPAAPGIKHASLHIVSSAGGPRDHYDFAVTATSVPGIAVEGPGGKILADGGTITFSPLAPGQQKDLILTIRNPGGAVLDGLAFTFDGPGSGDFSIPAPPVSVAPGGSVSVTLHQISLPQIGKANATLHLSSNLTDSRNPFDLFLKVEPGRADNFFQHFISGSIKSLALQANERILTTSESDDIMAYNPDGTSDTSFFPPSIVNVMPANCVAVQKDGKILLGLGTLFGSTDATLVRLNPDGTPDDTFIGPDIKPLTFSGVSCIAVLPNDKILIGGRFTMYIEPYEAGLALLHPDGSLDVDFNYFVNGSVACLDVQQDGKIVAGGDFTKTPEFPFDHIARVYPDGYPDESFVPDPIVVPTNSTFPLALTVQQDGGILAGGTHELVRFLPDGHRDFAVSVSDSLFDNYSVYDLALQADGKCFVAGGFKRIAGMPVSDFARINADGSPDATFDPVMESSNASAIRQAALQTDGRLLISGRFPAIDGDTSIRELARLQNDPATSLLKTSGNSTVRWLRGGSAPEVRHVTFDVKPDNSTAWTPLGAAARIPGGWELTGLVLPPSGSIRAQAYAGNSVMESVTPIRTAVEYWRMQYFNTPASTGEAADDADPDHDGLSNLVEYAFGLSPLDRAGSTPPPFVPTGESFTATFTAPADTEGILYSAEWSPTLLPGTWTEVTDTGTGATHVFSVPGGGERIFVRYVVKMR